jgi:hypothetical protein
VLPFIQTENLELAKTMAPRHKRKTLALSRPRGSRAGWVRKNMVMDQRKLDAARRALGVDTDTEAIDRALDFVAFRREVAEGIAAMRRAGGIEDVFESRRRS